MATVVSYHADGYAAARPAINVKVYGYAGLEHGKLYATLGDRRAEPLYEIAEEQVYGEFWADAASMAADLGLGPIEQEGRSGGWLVLTDGRDPQDPDTIEYVRDDEYTLDDPSVGQEIAVREWLAAYRQLADWCADQVREAPARVARLAQQLAMDEVGAEPARRMFAFLAPYPGESWAEVASRPDSWCIASPDGMGPHRPDDTTDPVTCAECGAELTEGVTA